MEGPALGELGPNRRSNQAQVIASGGVGDALPPRIPRPRRPSNVEGAIVGRALYERRFTVAEAIAALAG